MYRAVLNATKSSLAHIKKRIGSRASGGFLFIERPFFDVDVELTIPSVSMTPSLDDIQAAINRCSRAILGCSRQLLCWGRPEERELGKTIFEDIARDKEIVKMVLLLTGGFEGVKREVMSYLETFMNYEWLWTADKNTRYKEFMKNEPTLEDFDKELKRYVAVETARAAHIHAQRHSSP